MGFESMAQQPLEARFATAVPDGDAALADDIAKAIESIGGGAMRSLTGSSSKVTALEMTKRRTLVLINTDLAAQPAFAACRSSRTAARSPPGEVRVVQQPARPPVVIKRRAAALRTRPRRPRVIVENISPRVSGGPFAAKRIAGQTVTVEADAYADGHDVLAVELLWKAADEKEWQRTPMTPLGNARWQARFTPFRVGRHHYTVEAWLDEYATLCRAIRLKQEAGVDISRRARPRCDRRSKRIARKSCARTALSDTLAILQRRRRRRQRAGADLARNAQGRRRGRRAALRWPGTSRWRSRSSGGGRVRQPGTSSFRARMTDDPARHGTFDDVIAHLPRVRDMGFDVLYFPPIHPIGTKHRKGRNNTLTPAPDDVGSPYAIGSPEGGHDAMHPALGTLEDFRRLVAAAREHGLEIALDFAIQCSPDHPWLQASIPDWFSTRPDGIDQIRREPAEEVRGHRQRRLLCRGRGARPVAGAARRRAVLDRPRRARSSASTIRTPSRCRSGSG